MWVLFYVERRTYGDESQLWSENVYLHDVWELCANEKEAHAMYEDIMQRDSTHCAGIAPIKRGTDDWLD